MDSLEHQVQDSVIANGAAEASTSSPATPPPALTPALSDLSRIAEQGKDGIAPHTAAGGTAAPSKKFSAFNINKKFMEQNNSTPGTSQIPSSSSSKIVSTTAKSPPPPPTSHSRLVDAKLAKLPSSTAGTSTGWTRPSSTTPTLTPSPVSGGMSLVPPPVPAPASHGPPLLPHVGKVIQPQHRGAIQPPSRSKPESTNGSSKPAWRNVRQGESAATGIGVQSEFPTAAEVAQGRLNGVQEKKQSTETPAAPSSAVTEADTFRGVHLDPNAHHWDEMEEDNDDFLEGVIEFGDGRQYQIQPVDVSQTAQDPSPASVPAPEASSPGPQSPSAPSGVNKEDRFSDDIDRSWPRSAGLSSNIRPRAGPPAGASTSSSSSLSPQESSRVLFNWSNNNRIPPPDGRIGRDAPTHNNVQLLQKQGLDRSRELRRDTSSSQGTEDRRWERGRRPSNATTTHSALSGGGRDSSRESLRQLPPHLASVPKSLPPLYTHQLPQAPPSSSRHSSTREPWRQERSPEHSPVITSPSYASSHIASPTTPSAVAPSPQALTGASADMELARKAAMQSAAERAKLRRQRDEEEREKERERARKKAAELREKLKPADEEHPTVQESQPEPASPHDSTVSGPDRHPLNRPSSLKHSSRDPENGPTALITGFKPQRGTQSTNQPPSASSTVTSWRSSAAPLPPISTRRSSHSSVAPLVAFPSASQVLDVQLLNPNNDESLEEVEFDDLGKFIGMEPPEPEETVGPPPVQHGDIPTGDDQPRTRGDLEPFWRRKASPAPVEEQLSVVANALPETTSESPTGKEADTVPTSPSIPTASIAAKTFAEGLFPGQTLVVPPPFPSQRSPRAPSYREELRSTFDDTMSRIKGAMQTKPQRNALGNEHHPNRAGANSTAHPAEQPRFGRGVPPSPRSRLPRFPEPDEPFTTMTELDGDIQGDQRGRVKLPPFLRALEPLSKRQLANLKMSIPPLQWDVLSWDPPVEGMSVKDYSVNGVLFRKPPPLMGQPRFLVKLPPSGSYLIRRINSPTTPKVHLPAKPLLNKTVATAGAFGRPRAADESSTWRRTLPPIPDQVEATTSSEGLVTRSGSSPPDTDKVIDVTPSVECGTTQPVQWPTKSRAEPKMPAGAGVAFYRESTSCPSVSFTVSSELEDVRQPETSSMPLPTEEPASLSQPLGDSKGRDVDGSSALLTAREKAESKSSDGSSDTPLTPPSSTGWTKGLVKDSPVRQPDPEQLKLLWSQTSEKAGVPGVNSLEGIADDLPSVPFMLQEVKSEDGETPPPTGSNGPGPSRMSLHDVTRAFQQVPPPPAGSITGKASPQSPAIQPAASGSTRHPAFPPHAQPVHSVGAPPYPYHSPMLSHSPAPTLMYPHPIAPNAIMPGPSAQYPHAMWFPMAAHGGQTPGAPVRPIHSPYPAHPSYIPYPSPGAYAASPPGPPPNGTQNRSRQGGPAGLSPNLSHSRSPATVPMYQGSPVLVHPPAVMHVQPSYPGAMPAGRGVPMQASHPTPGPHAGGYTPTTHAPYPRPPW